MSARNRNDVHNELLSSAAEVCSRQWKALGGLARPLGEQACGAIVDPEALILLSFVARELDPRLDERLNWWARVGARHTSVQRIRTMVHSFPDEVAGAWRSFAVVAARHGGASWRAHVDDSAGMLVRERARAETDEPRLIEDSTLMLRLRIGFGVNAKADLLAFLISNGGSPFSASAMARELVYSETTTKRAARNMARAGLIRQILGHPVVYSIDLNAWARLLELEDDSQPKPPFWRPWAIVFPFVARALEWTRLDESTSSYLRASRARDSFEASRNDLERFGLEVPRPERYPGEAFEGAFLEMLSRLAQRMQEVA